MSKKPPGYDKKIAEIAARKDRFSIPREMWDERDWRVHLEETRRDRLMYQPLGEQFPILPTHKIAEGFGGVHGNPDAQRARERRLRANQALRKFGLGPKHW